MVQPDWSWMCLVRMQYACPGPRDGPIDAGTTGPGAIAWLSPGDRHRRTGVTSPGETRPAGLVPWSEGCAVIVDPPCLLLTPRLPSVARRDRTVRLYAGTRSCTPSQAQPPPHVGAGGERDQRAPNLPVVRRDAMSDLSRRTSGSSTTPTGSDSIRPSIPRDATLGLAARDQRPGGEMRRRADDRRDPCGRGCFPSARRSGPFRRDSSM